MNTENRSWKTLKSCAQSRLSSLEQNQRLRHPVLKPQYGLDFCSNDYLGSRTDQDFQACLHDRVRGVPFASGGSRLLGADHRDYQALELQFALWKKAPASLFLSSGYAANLATGYVLRDLGAEVFSDRLNHASMIDGQRLAKPGQGQCRVFEHNDLNDLEEKLHVSAADLKVIWTESLFSMDGDRAPLKELFDLARRYHALLVVDEAHTVGCEGENGAGSLSEQGLDAHQVITINPCGKALGAQGAFVTGPQWFLDCLVNHGRSFIYSTAPSPWVVQALCVTLERMPQWEDKRERLRQHVSSFANVCQQYGLKVEPQSWIVPIVVGDDQKTMAASYKLREMGVHLAGIRPPTVSPGSSRLRLSLRSDLLEEDIQCGIEALSIVIPS